MRAACALLHYRPAHKQDLILRHCLAEAMPPVPRRMRRPAAAGPYATNLDTRARAYIDHALLKALIGVVEALTERVDKNERSLQALLAGNAAAAAALNAADAARDSTAD